MAVRVSSTQTFVWRPSDSDDDDDNDGRDRTVAAKSDDDYQRPAKLDLIGKKEVVVFCFRLFTVCLH